MKIEVLTRLIGLKVMKYVRKNAYFVKNTALSEGNGAQREHFFIVKIGLLKKNDQLSQAQMRTEPKKMPFTNVKMRTLKKRDRRVRSKACIFAWDN